MDNFVIGFVIIIILFLASAYIYKSKKRGDKCIGCPYKAMCRRTDNKCNEG